MGHTGPTLRPQHTSRERMGGGNAVVLVPDPATALPFLLLANLALPSFAEQQCAAPQAPFRQLYGHVLWTCGKHREVGGRLAWWRQVLPALAVRACLDSSATTIRQHEGHPPP
jgi:hypothetical protein